MQTELADFIRDTPEGREADAILRKCVHCGFCNATCPTYQLLGDELDGPRGRIYLIKQVLEGAAPTAKTRLHLDRCLTCRACETTCPSGVQYGRLVDIGRAIVEAEGARAAPGKRCRGTVLGAVLPQHRLVFVPASIGQALQTFLPESLQDKNSCQPQHPPATGPRRATSGACSRSPAACSRRWRRAINAAAARVLDRNGDLARRGARRGLLRRAAFPPERPGRRACDDMPAR